MGHGKRAGRAKAPVRFVEVLDGRAARGILRVGFELAPHRRDGPVIPVDAEHTTERRRVSVRIEVELVYLVERLGYYKYQSL